MALWGIHPRKSIQTPEHIIHNYDLVACYKECHLEQAYLTPADIITVAPQEVPKLLQTFGDRLELNY